MKRTIAQTCLFLALTAILIITPTANVSAASPDSTLQISNLSGTTITVTYANLLTMPKTTVSADLYCYGALLTSGDWGGVKLSDLLDLVGLDSSVGSIRFTAQDGYAAGIPIETAMRSDVIVAYEENGVPLAEGLRLVIPGANGNIWIAQITSISMSTAALYDSQGQPGNSATSPATPPDSNTTTNPTTQQTSTQQQVQPQTSTPKNQTAIQPVAPPANIIEPEQSPQHQGSSSQGVPVEVGYGVALFGFIAVIAVGFVVFRRRKVRY